MKLLYILIIVFALAIVCQCIFTNSNDEGYEGPDVRKTKKRIQELEDYARAMVDLKNESLGPHDSPTERIELENIQNEITRLKRKVDSMTGADLGMPAPQKLYSSNPMICLPSQVTNGCV